MDDTEALLEAEGEREPSFPPPGEADSDPDALGVAVTVFDSVAVGVAHCDCDTVLEGVLEAVTFSTICSE